MAKPQLLFITGLGGKSTFWTLQVPAFSPKFDVITYDLQGRNTVEAMAKDAIELLDSRGVKRCHIVGHSTGGAIAQVIAEDHPERVDRLVLSATWSYCTEPFTALFKVRKKLIQSDVDSYAMHGALAGYPDDWLEAHPELLTQKPPASEVAPLLARMDAIMAFDRRTRLKDIKAKTLVVCAADDNVVPLGHSKRIAAGIPGAKLEVLPHAGHFPQVTATEAYNSLLLKFLAN